MREHGIRRLKNLNDRQRWMAAGSVIALLLVWFVLIRALDTSPIDSYNRCADAGNPVTESNPPTCTEGNRYYVGPFATPVPSTESLVSVPFEILVDGDSGGDFPRSSQLISDQSSWEDYWRWVHSARAAIPPILTVDFTTDSVIAISEGREVTSGYVYKVTNVSVGKNRTIIDIRESIPTITCKVANTPANRYFIIHTDKVHEPISYRISTERRKCT